jgi:hypothetical protein
MAVTGTVGDPHEVSAAVILAPTPPRRAGGRSCPKSLTATQNNYGAARPSSSASNRSDRPSPSVEAPARHRTNRLAMAPPLFFISLMYAATASQGKAFAGDTGG